MYASKGLYTVTLTVISSDGCTSTTVKTQLVNAADFNPTFSIPTITCSGIDPEQFADLTTPPGTATWNFGDGGVGSGSPVSHDFSAPGTYTVTLTETFGACVVSASKPVKVLKGLNPAGFVITMDSVCGAPAMVSFQDTSAAAVKWAWNFDGLPGDTASGRAPSFTYPANGTYNPTLTITAANGCMGTVSKPISINPPTAVIAAVQTTSPSDSVCSIINVALGAVSPDTLVQYNWDFGDGTTGSGANPTHSYAQPGTYDRPTQFHHQPRLPWCFRHHPHRGVSQAPRRVQLPRHGHLRKHRGPLQQPIHGECQHVYLELRQWRHPW